jgi:hypothetical protein
LNSVKPGEVLQVKFVIVPSRALLRLTKITERSSHGRYPTAETI